MDTDTAPPARLSNLLLEIHKWRIFQNSFRKLEKRRVSDSFPNYEFDMESKWVTKSNISSKLIVYVTENKTRLIFKLRILLESTLRVHWLNNSWSLLHSPLVFLEFNRTKIFSKMLDLKILSNIGDFLVSKSKRSLKICYVIYIFVLIFFCFEFRQ